MTSLINPDTIDTTKPATGAAMASSVIRAAFTAIKALFTIVKTEIESLQDIQKAWTPYTPIVTAQSGSITSASVTGSYIKIGATVCFNVNIVITTVGTASGGLFFTLPFPSKYSTWKASGSDNNGKMISSGMGLGNNGIGYMVYYDTTSPISAGANLSVSGVYETAS